MIRNNNIILEIGINYNDDQNKLKKQMESWYCKFISVNLLNRIITIMTLTFKYI